MSLLEVGEEDCLVVNQEYVFEIADDDLSVATESLEAVRIEHRAGVTKSKRRRKT